MGWEVVSFEPTKAQRRLVHIGADELARHPEYVKLLDSDEAATLIGLLLKIRDRAKEKSVQGYSLKEPETDK